MRGYFAIGVEGISKAMNAGNLFRSAHAFGAQFVFTVAADPRVQQSRADTSRTPEHLPWYDYAGPGDLVLPSGCQLVGVELLDEAIELPSFRHPQRAAYVFGPERGALSAALSKRCDHLIRIPTGFCINLATAGAIVMYDRLLTHGRFAERPLSQQSEPIPAPDHVHGGPRRRRMKK
jgi:tRNA G18 (ribose-2'-O)-methylase SpoU